MYIVRGRSGMGVGFGLVAQSLNEFLVHWFLGTFRLLFVDRIY